MLTEGELSEKLSPYLTRYQGGFFGPTLYEQFRNGWSGYSALKGLKDQIEDEDVYNRYARGLRNQMGNAAVGAATTLLGGMSTAAMAGNNLSSIANTDYQQQLIDEIGNRGLYGYNSYDQWAHDYDESLQPDLSFDTIRGTSTREKIGGIATPAIAGLQAGMTIGGPWAAAGLGLAGLGYGLFKNAEGNQKAWTEKTAKENALATSNAISLSNRNAAGERISDNNNRLKAINVGAKGGQLTIQQFADQVLGKRRSPSEEPVRRIVHQHCKGGTMIRFRK